MGKFDRPLKDEPASRAKKGEKRKHEMVTGDSQTERKRVLAMADKITGRRQLTLETDKGTMTTNQLPLEAPTSYKADKQGKKRKTQKKPKLGLGTKKGRERAKAANAAGLLQRSVKRSEKGAK